MPVSIPIYLQHDTVHPFIAELLEAANAEELAIDLAGWRWAEQFELQRVAVSLVHLCEQGCRLRFTSALDGRARSVVAFANDRGFFSALARAGCTVTVDIGENATITSKDGPIQPRLPSLPTYGETV